MSKCIKLDGVKLGNKCVYLAAEDRKLKVGTRGVAVDPANLVYWLPKSERRKFRKALRAAGHTDLIQDTITR